MPQRQFFWLAVADDGRRNADHGLELGGGGVGPRFLDEPQTDPQHDHGQHDGWPAGIVIFVAPIGNDRQYQQQDHQGVGTGLAEDPELAESLLLGDYVGAVLFKAAGGLFLAQALLARSQPAQHFRGFARGDFAQ